MVPDGQFRSISSDSAAHNNGHRVVRRIQIKSHIIGLHLDRSADGAYIDLKLNVCVIEAESVRRANKDPLMV